MDTVLGTFAGRAALAVTFVAAVAALAAPAGASATPSHRGAAPVHARAQAGADVQIGHAVKYVVTSDGAIVRVR